MSKVILCADIGTSSLKTAFIDETGKVLAFAKKTFLFRYTEHAAEEWTASLKACCSELTIQTKEISPVIDAICISGNGPTLVGETGETLLWNAPVEQKGSSLFISRILYFKNKYKMAWAFGNYIFSGPEFLIWKLTENAVTILPEERFIPAYWTKEELIKEGLSEKETAKLPPFVAPGFCAGPLCAKAAEFLLPALPSLSPDAKVYCGAPDFVSALTGTNTLVPGKLCDRTGSSEGLNLCTEKPVYSKNIRTLPSVIPGLWNASFLIPDSGIRFANYKQKLERMSGRQNISYTDLLEEILSDSKCSENETLIEGRNLLNTILDELKSALDELLSACKDAGCTLPDSFTVTGGQAKNPLLNKLKEEKLGLKLIVPSCADSELIGDAAFAFTSMGIFPSLQKAAESLAK